MAFNTSSGRYQHVVVPYGLSKVPSIFQYFINNKLHDMLGCYVIAYINDILICTPNLETHVTRSKPVLKQLLKHQLYVKAEKSQAPWTCY